LEKTPAVMFEILNKEFFDNGILMVAMVKGPAFELVSNH